MIDGEKDTDEKRLAVRMSWRSEPNWAGVPMILLDASASPKIIAKVFARRVVQETISARMNLRTVAILDHSCANSQFKTRPGSTDDQKKMAMAARRKMRLVTDKVATMMGHSRLLVGSTTSVQLDLTATKNERWEPLPNVDWRHYGALRGLDFAKHHAAAMSIGRSEQPIRVVDGYAAALTYDDEKPQAPYDAKGNEWDYSTNKSLQRVPVVRRIRMRSGIDYDHTVMSFPEQFSWACEVESQWREEELRQFVGRLRSVYRSGTPGIYICVGKILADDLVVDEIVNMDDLLGDADYFRINRAAGGILDDHILPKIPLVAKILNDRSIRDVVEATFGDKVVGDNKYLKAFSRSSWTIKYRSEGRVRGVRVMGYHPDPKAALYAAASKAGVVIDEIVSVTDPACRADLPAAKADWVAEEAAARAESHITDTSKSIHERIPHFFGEVKAFSMDQVTDLVRKDPDNPGILDAFHVKADRYREIGAWVSERIDVWRELYDYSSDWEEELKDEIDAAIERCEAGGDPGIAFSKVEAMLAPVNSALWDA